MGKEYEKTCLVCRSEFLCTQPNKKFCSRDCISSYWINRNGRGGLKRLGISSGTTGAISELKASSFLMENGYSVFRALSPSCFCDIIAIKGKETIKIEVRTGYKSESGKIYYPKRANGDIDFFLVCVNSSNEFHLIPYKK